MEPIKNSAILYIFSITDKDITTAFILSRSYLIQSLWVQSTCQMQLAEVKYPVDTEIKMASFFKKSLLPNSILCLGWIQIFYNSNLHLCTTESTDLFKNSLTTLRKDSQKLSRTPLHSIQDLDRKEKGQRGRRKTSEDLIYNPNKPIQSKFLWLAKFLLSLFLLISL